jgi:long-subunit fatty acid transport protein
MMISNKTTSMQIIFLFVAIFAFICMTPSLSRGATNEQMNIDAVSIARANTMAADPKGASSLYWNPAALVNLPEGGMKETSLGYVYIKVYLETHSDPNFKGFMNTFGPQAEDPGDRDPLDGAKGTNTCNGILQLPIINKALPFIAAPSTGATYRKPESKWAFANKMFVPYGGGMENRDPSLPGYYSIEKVYQLNLRYLNPGFGYSFSDTFSVGMTATAGMTIFGLKKPARSPSHMTALTKVLGRATKDFNIPVWSQENVGGPFYGGGIHPYENVLTFEADLKDYFSPAYQLGFLWQPKQYFTFGGVYMSAFENQLYGKYKFTYSEAYRRMVDWYGSTPYLTTQAAILDLPYSSVPYQTGKVHMIDYIYPQRVQLGVMVTPVKRLRLLCDLHWAEWSAMDYLEFQFDRPIQALQSAKMTGHVYGSSKIKNATGYKDTFHWSYASEFDISKKLTFRCGYEYRKSSVEMDMFSSTNMPDCHKYGVGFEIRLPKGVKIDLAYGYLTGDIYVPNNTSDNLNSLSFIKTSTSPYAGLDVYQKWTMKQVNFNITQPLPTQIDTENRKTDKLKKIKENLKYSIQNMKDSFKNGLKKLSPFK